MERMINTNHAEQLLMGNNMIALFGREPELTQLIESKRDTEFGPLTKKANKYETQGYDTEDDELEHDMDFDEFDDAGGGGC
eukprot:10353-Heterococcus_DN1.PRE.3